MGIFVRDMSEVEEQFTKSENRQCPVCGLKARIPGVTSSMVAVAKLEGDNHLWQEFHICPVCTTRYRFTRDWSGLDIAKPAIGVARSVYIS